MDPEHLRLGIDGPRPLPPALRQRVEEALLAETSERAPRDAPSEALPPAVRDRLEQLLATDAGPHDDAVPELSGVDRARPLPPVLRERLIGALGGGDGDRRPTGLRRARRRRRFVRVAPPPRAGASWWERTRDVRVVGTVVLLVVVMLATFVDQARRRRTDETATGAPPGTAAGNATPEAGPPPFAFPFVAERAGATPGEDRLVPDAPPLPAHGAPIRVGVVLGDARQEAGFRGYVRVLNSHGGIDGRPVHAVVVDPRRAPLSRAVVAVANMSGTALATDPGARAALRRIPLLETLSAPEHVLRGPVLGVAGPVRRQAHLAVDEVFPEPSPGAVAIVVEAADGVFAGEVATAFAEALDERQVEVRRVRHRRGAPVSLPPASVVFLSLDTDDARDWLRAARDSGYAPPTPVVGVASLLEPSLLPELAEGTLVVGPYLLPAPGPEDDALRAAVGEAPGAAAVHGWVTAKTLAVALWRAGSADADDPPEVARALARLDGYQEALTPAYAVRPGTTARTPEGAVFGVTPEGFLLLADFRADTFS